MHDTGYGSDAFARVARNERVLVYIDGSSWRDRWLRVRSGAIERARYRRRLPSLTVWLTAAPGGQMIGEHLAIREGRRYRFREAQGVLALPATFADYQRGRHRQAMRTNTRRARAAGLVTAPPTVERWGPPEGDIREPWVRPGPIERWTVRDAKGTVAGEAILTVDEHVALLHGLVSTVNDARWLLHSAIVERLCGRCDLLLTNSAAMYRESYGNHHFQRLLGYELARLRVAHADGRRARAAAELAPTRPAAAATRSQRERVPQRALSSSGRG